MALRIGRPGSGRAGKWAKEEHDDHLHAFVGLSERPNEKTQFGESDAVHCDYVVCLDDNFVGTDVMVYGMAIVPALVDGMADNDVIVARLGKGQAKPGQSPPWLLYDPTDEDLERCEKWLAAYSAQLPSGALVIEPPAPAGADESF